VCALKIISREFLAKKCLILEKLQFKTHFTSDQLSTLTQSLQIYVCFLPRVTLSRIEMHIKLWIWIKRERCLKLTQIFTKFHQF
jgi:hypothetical protein